MPHALKQERDRFVGFAFATAHLLLEIDLSGAILFAAGAACGLVDGPAEQLVGRTLGSLVAAEDREFLDHLLRRLGSTGSIGLTRVNLSSIHGRRAEFVMGGRRTVTGEPLLHLGLILSSMLTRVQIGRAHV